MCYPLAEDDYMMTQSITFRLQHINVPDRRVCDALHFTAIIQDLSCNTELSEAMRRDSSDE